MVVAENTILTTKLRIRPDAFEEFAKWREKMNVVVAAYPGFVSLEVISPLQDDEVEWVSVQRFRSSHELEAWRNSKEREELLAEIAPLLVQDGEGILEVEKASYSQTQSVTEVFVTKVGPGMHKAYRSWASKIQQVEAQFPGYQGVYIQAPASAESENWITILRFDTPENLDNWLCSKERRKLLDEAESMVENLESHQVISPFAGWFADRSNLAAPAPPAWKQTMIVLLILFPIVVLEIKFLLPLLKALNPAFSTFIGNAISVTLITWPMMPIVLPLLRWWLYPKGKSKKAKTFGGICVLLGCYLIELGILWNLLV